MKIMPAIIGAVGLQVAICSNCLASERMDDGMRVYQAACASCHDTGVDGAPVTDRPEDWENRSNLWEAVLLEHANKGYLDMPARGGQEKMPEYDVDVTAEYMLNIAHPNLPRD